MKPKKYKVRLTEEERKELERITRRGKHSAAMVKRANILLNLDESHGLVGNQKEIAAQLSTINSTDFIPLFK